MGRLMRLSGLGQSPTRDFLNITSPEFKANPHPYYARLRAETPIRRLGRPNIWIVTGYDEAALLLKDERFAQSSANALTPEQRARLPLFVKLFNTVLFKALNRSMIASDPPDHTRLRALVNKAFTPRLIEGMRPRIQRLADALLDAVKARGRMDLVRHYAYPIPTTVIAVMLGVPPKDRHHFNRWIKAMALAVTVPGLTKALPNVWMLTRYIRNIIQQRRSNPRDDLTSALVRVEEAGNVLSEDELVAMIFLLLFAGFETTANLIGNGALALLQHPDQLERLRQEPSLIKSAVEELLRFTSPVDLSTTRYAREDVPIAGVTIARGDAVLIAIGSANRDQRQFDKPDELDIAREPNKHLSFGLGAHFCLGAPLARLEAQIAIDTLVRRLPDLRLALPPAALRWRPAILFRGLESLPVTFDAGMGPSSREGRG